MTIADKTVLVTGANPRHRAGRWSRRRWRRGARRVYAGTRKPLSIVDSRVHPR